MSALLDSDILVRAEKATERYTPYLFLLAFVVSHLAGRFLIYDISPYVLDVADGPFVRKLAVFAMAFMYTGSVRMAIVGGLAYMIFFHLILHERGLLGFFVGPRENPYSRRALTNMQRESIPTPAKLRTDDSEDIPSSAKVESEKMSMYD